MTVAILLPGITVPAHIAYASLSDAFGESARLVTKELEVYRGDRPPDDYSLDLEIDGLDRFADDLGVERFHLVGHSLGASIALAYAAEHDDRVASLALNEPATDFSAADRAAIAAEGLDRVPADERMAAFVRQFVRPGVALPPPPATPPGPEMAKRPAGVAAAIAAVDTHDVDPERLRRYTGPVLYSYGALSNARWEAMAARLPELLPRCTVMRYEERHHLDAPPQAEPERVAAALRALWARTDAPAAPAQDG